MVGGAVALLTAAVYWVLSGTSSGETTQGVLMYLVLATVSVPGYTLLLRLAAAPFRPAKAVKAVN